MTYRYSLLADTKENVFALLTRMQEVVLRKEVSVFNLDHYMKTEQVDDGPVCRTAGCLLGWCLTERDLAEKLGLSLRTSMHLSNREWPTRQFDNGIFAELSCPSEAMMERGASELLFSSAMIDEEICYGAHRKIAWARIELIRIFFERDRQEELRDANARYLRQSFYADAFRTEITGRFEFVKRDFLPATMKFDHLTDAK